MISKRKEINIYGEPFCFDAATDCLVHQRVPSFHIPFSHLRDMGDSYLLPFYPHFQNSTLLDVSAQGVMAWPVPTRVELDPEGMAEKYGVHQEEIGGKSDFEVMVNQEMYMLRKLGKLPTVKLCDLDFIIDLRYSELRVKSDFARRSISFHDINQYRGIDVVSDEKDKLWFPYEPEKRSVSNILFRRLEIIPPEIVMIELPNEKTLDPFNYARANQIDIQAFLKLNPIQGFEFEAKIIPWGKTNLPEIIRENVNRKIVMTQRSGIAKNIKKGKGI